MTRRVVGTTALALVIVGGCGDSVTSRSDVMAAYGTDVAVPAFEAHAAHVATVVDAVARVCEDPASASDALDAVEAARTGWLATEAHWTGPVKERRVPARTDWLVNGAEIEELIDQSAPGEIDGDVIARRVGADNRGLSAMRWVLERDDVVALLGDQRWCDYLTANAEVIRTDGDLLVGDWTGSWDDGPAFVDAIAAADETDAWLGMLVNDNLALVHRLTEPVVVEGDAPPVNVAADRVAGLTGLRAVATSLRPLLGDGVGGRLLEEIDAATAALEAGDVEQGRAAAQEVERTLSTDVAGRLGVTIGFSDADGDSAG